MRPTALIPLILFLAAAPASAQVYRWVDEQGTVNYANQPPSDGRQAARIDTRESRVSIIPLREVRASRTPPMAVTPAPASFPGSVDRLTVSNLQNGLEWRERCFAERRVDCTNPTGATYDFGTTYAPNSPFAAAPR
jgi:hypothetical protein